MRFVPIKTLEQQTLLCLHRVRQRFIEERTATINRLRELLAEFCFVMPQKAAEVRRRATEWLEQLLPHAACAVRDLREHLRVLDARVKEYERSIARSKLMLAITSTRSSSNNVWVSAP